MKSIKKKNIKKSFNCFICGKNSIGKKTLLYTCLNNKIPDEEAKSFLEYRYGFEGYHDVFVENYDITLRTIVLSGPNDFKNVRKIEYFENDVIIFCFSLADMRSFKNVKEIYFPELEEWSIKKPYILVGLQKDIRDSKLKKLLDNNIITTEMGEQLKNEIGAPAYIECSSYDMINVHKVFEETSRVVRQASYETDNNKDSCCSIS